MRHPGAPNERGRATEQELAGREANARQLAEAGRNAVAIVTAVASVIVTAVLKVSFVGLLAVLAGAAALLVLRVGAHRVRTHGRSRPLGRVRVDARVHDRLGVLTEAVSEPALRTAPASRWYGPAPVYGGLAAYFIAASARTTSVEAFGAAMATVVTGSAPD